MGLAQLMATMIYLKDTNTLMKDTPGVEQGPRRFVYKTLSLDDIKLVKDAMGVVRLIFAILLIIQKIIDII